MWGDIDHPVWGEERGRVMVKYKVECQRRQKNSPGDLRKRVPVQCRGEHSRRVGRAAAISFLLKRHSPLWLDINILLKRHSPHWLGINRMLV